MPIIFIVNSFGTIQMFLQVNNALAFHVFCTLSHGQPFYLHQLKYQSLPLQNKSHDTNIPML